MPTSPEVLALRARPANLLTNEELWLAHGNFIKMACIRVCKRFPSLQIQQEELWGYGFEIMVTSARNWRPDGGANFTSYFSATLYPKLYDHLWKTLGDARPRPHGREIHDPCTGYFSRNEAEALAEQREATSPAGFARRRLMETSEAYCTERLGSHNLYEMRPDQVAELKELMERIRNRLTDLNAARSLPVKERAGRKRMIKRLRRVWIEGEIEADLAREEGLTRAAINKNVVDGRLLLRHLIGGKLVRNLKYVQEQEKKARAKKAAAK